MDLSLRTKKLKYGWRAYVYDDKKCVWSTPKYFDTEEEVIECAKKYFCAPWNFSE